MWVTVDAEDHTTTDSTLAIVRELRSDYPWLGAVVQSYLRRTEDDCRALAGPGSRVRLCKGAYREPESVAFQDRAAVDASYLRCLGILMDGSGYPMVASHDPAVIDAVAPLVGRTGRAADAYEHQMLFGIRDVEQRRLANEDKQVRVYVRTEVSGTRTSCGGWPSVPRTCGSSCARWSPGTDRCSRGSVPARRAVVEFRGDDFWRGMDQRGPLRGRSRTRDAARFDAHRRGPAHPSAAHRGGVVVADRGAVAAAVRRPRSPRRPRA